MISAILKRSQFLFRISLLVSFFGLYMVFLFEDGFLKSTQTLEAHSLWLIDDYKKEMNSRAKDIEFGKEPYLIFLNTGRANGFQFPQKDLSHKGKAFPIFRFDPVGDFQEGRSLRGYISNATGAIYSTPTVCMPDPSELSLFLNELFLPLSKYEPTIYDFSFVKTRNGKVHMTLFLDFSKDTQKSEVMALLNTKNAAIKPSFSADFWRLALTHQFNSECTEFFMSLSDWEAQKEKPCVPINNEGKIDLQPLRDLLVLTEGQSTAEVLRYAKTVGSEGMRSSNILTIPLDFIHQPWLVLMVVFFFQFYALLYIWPIRENLQFSEKEALPGWAAVLTAKLYNAMFLFELSLPVFATLAISFSLNRAWLSVPLASFIVSYFYWSILRKIAADYSEFSEKMNPKTRIRSSRFSYKRRKTL